MATVAWFHFKCPPGVSHRPCVAHFHLLIQSRSFLSCHFVHVLLLNNRTHRAVIVFFYTTLGVSHGCVSASREGGVEPWWRTEHVLGAAAAAAPARVSMSYFSEALPSFSCRDLAPRGLKGRVGRLEPRARQGVSEGRPHRVRALPGRREAEHCVAAAVGSARPFVCPPCCAGMQVKLYRNRSQPEIPVLFE